MISSVYLSCQRNMSQLKIVAEDLTMTMTMTSYDRGGVNVLTLTSQLANN